MKVPGAGDLRRYHLLLLVAVIVIYAATLVHQRDAVPPGLNNDAAEEALRGLKLLEEGRFEPITTVVGNSAETLYLYLAGISSLVLGPGTLAVQACSWLMGAACLVLLFYAARRLVPSSGAVSSMLVSASSVWLFHYARCGLRAITSACFTAAFILALDAVERFPGNRRRAVAAGCVLGLSLYSYTACRILPIAFALYVVIRLLDGENRRGRLRSYAALVAGTLVVSIPNLLFMIQYPREFLSRGSYVLTGGISESARNLFFSLLLPVYYHDTYRELAGEGFFFDGVSAGLAATGINPVHPLVSLLLLVGCFACWRRRKEPLVLCLMLLWLCGTLFLGLAGPSLTRFLVLLPVYLLVAIMGLSDLSRSKPYLRIVVRAVLVVVLVSHGLSYFKKIDSTDRAYLYFSPRTTPLAERALELAEEGFSVACVVSRHAGVVRYMTYMHRDDVRLLEFYGRPPDFRKVFRRQPYSDVVLLEQVPAWGDLKPVVPPGWTVTARGPAYLEIKSAGLSNGSAEDRLTAEPVL